MKASSLIQELQMLVAEFGDKNVEIFIDEGRQELEVDDVWATDNMLGNAMDPTAAVECTVFRLMNQS